MGENKDFEIYEVLNHPTRRLIIKILHERGTCSFTELMKEIGENTGSLSFHLDKLKGVISQAETKKYFLNPIGEKSYFALQEMDSIKADKSPMKQEGSAVVLANGEEKVVISSEKVRPLGHDHLIPSFTKSTLFHVNATLTNRRLILSAWRFFGPVEIQLNRIKLVRVRKDIPLTKGDLKGQSIEVTYSDEAGNLHWVRFAPPEIQKWLNAIKESSSKANQP